MNKTVSFIGAGNMGGALIESACRTVSPAQVCVASRSREKPRALSDKMGCRVAESNTAAAAFGDYVFLCVKPQVLPEVLGEIGPELARRADAGKMPCLISIAAGVQISAIRAALPENCGGMSVLRVMPNVTVAVGKGMLALSADGTASRETLEDVKAILARAGLVDELDEKLMDAFTAVAGCLPAYVFMFLEAVADGGVMAGLPRAKALEYAAQTSAGSAEMVLETGTHPGALKDTVCSPAGSTIAGLAALERRGFRGAAMMAIEAAYRRNQGLGA